MRTGNILTSLCLLVCLAALPVPATRAQPPGNSLLTSLTETLAAPLCTDAWRNTRPCRASAWQLRDSVHPAEATSRWWAGLWSAAGEVAASPRLLFAGRRASCGTGQNASSLLKLDFPGFQLDMDIDLDTEEERFDTVRFAYRSCWR